MTLPAVFATVVLSLGVSAARAQYPANADDPFVNLGNLSDYRTEALESA